MLDNSEDKQSQEALRLLRLKSFEEGFDTGKDSGYDYGVFDGKKAQGEKILELLKDIDLPFTKEQSTETLRYLAAAIENLLAVSFEPKVIENFLSEKDRTRLVEIIDESEASGIMHPADEITRGHDGRIMLWDEENQEFLSIIKKYLRYVANIYDKELFPHNIAMLKYYSGPGMALHTDSIGICRETCTVTSVVYLNDDYSGGEVSFPIINKKYKLSAGSVMHFPQRGLEAYHEISEITNGNRYAILTCYTKDLSVVNDLYKD
jgi:hypothetical protein